MPEDPARRERRLKLGAAVLLDHERVERLALSDRVQVCMRLMSERRWKKSTSAALARVWKISRGAVRRDACEASRRLRVGDAELIEKRFLLASSILNGGLAAECLPLALRLEVQSKALKATEGMFAKVTKLQIQKDPALEGFTEAELNHFARVDPDDCDVFQCRVHTEEAIAKILEGS